MPFRIAVNSPFFPRNRIFCSFSRVICPGKVYRKDDDATHSPMFHQIEGLMVDKNIRMSDLNGLLLSFCQEMFGKDTNIRLRPSYFPLKIDAENANHFHTSAANR